MLPAILPAMIVASPRCRVGRWVTTGALLALASCTAPDEIADLDYHRGRNALAMSRWDWARFYFAADLERHPGRPESLRGLGIGWISGYRGSLSHAVEAFERYLEVAPDDAEIRLRLTRTLMRAGEGSRALGVLDGLEQTHEARLLAARIHLAEDPESALPHLGAALRTAPDDFETRHLAARVHARLGEDEAAIAHARRAAEIDPASAELCYLTARILRRQGKLEESAAALDVYEMLRQLPGPGAAIAPRAELALVRRLEDRLPATSFALDKRLARLLLKTGRIDEAPDLLGRILSDPACDPDSVLLLAQTAHTQGRIAIARDLYQRVLDRDPSHQKALAQQALLAYESQDFATARRLLDRGLELDPQHAPLHFATGLLALAQGEDDRAVDALTTVVSLVPWLPRYRLTLADVLLTRGDRGAVERLLADVPAPDPEIEAYREKHAL